MTESELLKIAVKKGVNFRFLRLSLKKRRPITCYNSCRQDEEKLTITEFDSFKKLIIGGN